MNRSRGNTGTNRRLGAAPAPAVKRLSLYLRQLEALAERGVEKISSRQLADALHLAGAQVRKDLAYFGQFGRPGVGYRVDPLIEALRVILGTNRIWNVIVVGAGDLGRALLRYRGFHRRGFQVVAAFDVAQSKVNKRVGSVTVYPLQKLEQVVREKGVKLAVVTVPSDAAQSVTDLLSKAGILGILNFAPRTLNTPEGVAVAPVDLAAHLEQLSFQVATAAAGV